MNDFFCTLLLESTMLCLDPNRSAGCLPSENAEDHVTYHLHRTPSLHSGYLRTIACILGVSFFFITTYLFTTAQARITIQSTTKGKKPPIAPYLVPLLGHLVPFLFDLESLFTALVNRFGTSLPIRIVLGTEQVILLTGAQNIKKVWKSSQWLTAKAGHLIGLRTILDTPERSMDFYRADNSGIGKEPLPLSNVPPEHRVWHLTHQPIVDCLSGANLNIFTESFHNSMIERIEQWDIGYQWTDMPDLFTFIYSEVMQVQLELLCGTFFLDLNPAFVRDFRHFHHAMIHLKKGLPRWMTPESCRARSVCLNGMKKWHKAVRLNDPDMLVDTGEIQNPRFGNEIMRSRRRIMAKMEVMDDETAASADLGMLWALNANPATASFWLLLEIIRDPTLHPLIHHEISTSTALLPPMTLQSPIPNHPPPSIPSISMPLLNDSPLLQSMYAETLRLRVSTLIIQSPEFSDFDFNGWLLPKDKLVLISSRIAHMDRRSWLRRDSEGEEIPVDEFCAERFLTWGKDNGNKIREPKISSPNALDPGNSDSKPKEKSTEPHFNPPNTSHARFSVANLAGKWIPYGGGPGICPGRHFAKNIMLLTSALMFSAFEMQLKVDEGWKPQMDMRYYGLGVLPPRGEVPFRIRRRERRVVS